MKKLVTFFISALFLFSLAACTEKKAEEAKVPEKKMEQPAKPDTSVADTAKTAEPAPEK